MTAEEAGIKFDLAEDEARIAAAETTMDSFYEIDDFISDYLICKLGDADRDSYIAGAC